MNHWYNFYLKIMDDFRESNLEMEDDINYGFDPVPASKGMPPLNFCRGGRYGRIWRWFFNNVIPPPSGTGSKTITLFIGTDAEWDSQGAVSCQIDIKTKFQGNTFRQKYILLNKKFEDKICLKKISDFKQKNNVPLLCFGGEVTFETLLELGDQEVPIIKIINRFLHQFIPPDVLDKIENI